MNIRFRYMYQTLNTVDTLYKRACCEVRTVKFSLTTLETTKAICAFWSTAAARESKFSLEGAIAVYFVFILLNS